MPKKISFPTEVIQTAISAANYVFSTVKYRAWDENEMKLKWQKRGVNDVYSDGSVNYLVPCLETAALAAIHLHDAQLQTELTVYTDAGALLKFREGKKRILHTDALAEWRHAGNWYGLNIGSYDVTILKRNDEQGRTLERHDGTIWTRVPIYRTQGKSLRDHANRPILDVLKGTTLINPPQEITLEDFRKVNHIKGRPDFLSENGKYIKDVTAAFAKWFKEWHPVFPGLQRIRYENGE